MFKGNLGETINNRFLEVNLFSTCGNLDIVHGNHGLWLIDVSL